MFVADMQENSLVLCVVLVTCSLDKLNYQFQKGLFVFVLINSLQFSIHIVTSSVNKNDFISFLSVSLFFFSLLYQVEHSLKGLVREDILAFFPVLGGKHSLSIRSLSAVGFSCTPIQVKEWSFCFQFLESFQS